MAFAVVLSHLTAEKSGASTTSPKQTTSAPAQAVLQKLPYRLTFSAEPAEVKLTSGDQPAQTTAIGILEAPEHAALFLEVKWKTPAAPDEHRFAKLVLEPPGKPTITHVFDAEGDIDDVFELP